MSEIIFEVREDEADGVYTTTALGYGIHTRGYCGELSAMVRDAVACYFNDAAETPQDHPPPLRA